MQRRGEAETRGGLWDKTRIGYRIPDALELTTRQKANELIKNPNWVNEAMRKIHGGENAAEGHGEAIDDEEAVSDDGADRADDDVDEDD
jgi:RNA polymerase II-associated factor 1